MDGKVIEKIKRILDDFPELLVADVSGKVYTTVPEDQVVEFAGIRSHAGEIFYLIPTIRDYQEYVLFITTEKIPAWFRDDKLKEI